MGPRDAVTLPKLEQAQKDFQSQREKYQRIRDDLSVKVKLLEENKVRFQFFLSLPFAHVPLMLQLSILLTI